MAQVVNNQITFPIFSILAIVFTILKFTNYINWSWWWILSPLWIPIVIIFVVFISIFVFLLIKEIVMNRR